jgi:hypothetical protein
MIRCLFRSPDFPLICDAGNVLLGAVSPQDFADQAATLNLPADANLPVVDASAEGWVFNTEHVVVSPLTTKKRWTKKEVITLFNGSREAGKLGTQYSERSLSAKRFDRIITEIVELIRAANNTSELTSGGRADASPGGSST